MTIYEFESIFLTKVTCNKYTYHKVPPKEPVKETPKVPVKETSKEPSKEKESKKNGKEIQVIHSSSENEGEPEKETRVAGQNMNQTMTKLYSTPSKQTDFEKIKTAAKVAEKTVGKYLHPLINSGRSLLTGETGVHRIMSPLP